MLIPSISPGIPVGKFHEGELKVSTVGGVTDSDSEFETAVLHPSYSEYFIVVEEYDTEEDALKGHKKWVDIMTSENLPEELIDVSSSESANSERLSGVSLVFKKVH